ncbi:MarR family winged helix-turn-helix transcriptional regulator [Quadrisphaera sp. INWT6]|uniref:MarR family winged helix-turn-helix transcriptional regulator n=1 Tax=Quadrisphaera sp. INWT6 TaxID=2596917 RepID=UPI0018923C00|nr:MarR family winged helix-turn-helix transcriptional regulator [Quadrisphaera sp. INWT6]MBF5082167.1 winged helix-turn-helix transcriptional regulator [Quadrisphaera sp. INWT6]
MSREPLIAWELVSTAHVVGQRFADLFAGLGLTPTQFAVLMHLDAEEGLSQTELARRVLVRQQSMGVLLASMLERGLVERTGPGGRGRRAGLVLTETGGRALREAWPAVRAFNAPEALGLTPDGAVMLVQGLQQMRTSATAPERPT